MTDTLFYRLTGYVNSTKYTTKKKALKGERFLYLFFAVKRGRLRYLLFLWVVLLPPLISLSPACAANSKCNGVSYTKKGKYRLNTGSTAMPAGKGAKIWVKGGKFKLNSL